MEDYIFIIIAIALSIVGAVSRNKNKKSPASTDSEGFQPMRKPGFFDQFLNEAIFDADPVSKPTVAPVQQPAPVERNKKYEKDIQKKFLNIESSKTRIKRVPYELTKVESIKKKFPGRKTKGVHELMKDFSLRKAIIYSEIIDRKY